MKDFKIVLLREIELNVMRNNLLNVNRISDYITCLIGMQIYQPVPAMNTKMKTQTDKMLPSSVATCIVEGNLSLTGFLILLRTVSKAAVICFPNT